MKIAILFTGGKDSVYTTYYSIKQGFEVMCLVSMKSENKDSYMFHTPNIGLVELQARAMGLPLIMKGTKGEKEKEVADLKQAIKQAVDEFGIEAIGAGALFSNYQRDRVLGICNELGLKLIAPMWQKEQGRYMLDLIDLGFEMIIVAVAGEGFTKAWLGRKIDSKALQDLNVLNKKFGVHAAGEGGEYESLVLDCPIFAKRLEITKARKEMENECTGKYIVEDCVLADK